MVFDGPLAASAYELLGVAPTASDDELRRAYRLRMRQTHPDTGGDAALFVAVQRAWEQVGTPQGRTAYDRGRGAAHPAWAMPAAARATGTRPRGRSHGHAGAERRRRYRALLDENIADARAYDPGVVRAAPWAARRLLARALAEEATAAAVDELGIGFTAWHEVVVNADADVLLDHVVLGPRGVYGLLSQTFGTSVRFRQGEVIGPGLDGTPVADLVGRTRAIGRAAGVRFSGAILVLPDEELHEPVTSLGGIRGVPVLVVSRSALRPTLRSGMPQARPFGGPQAFDVRSRLSETLRVRTP